MGLREIRYSWTATGLILLCVCGEAFHWVTVILQEEYSVGSPAIAVLFRSTKTTVPDVTSVWDFWCYMSIHTIIIETWSKNFECACMLVWFIYPQWGFGTEIGDYKELLFSNCQGLQYKKEKKMAKNVHVQDFLSNTLPFQVPFLIHSVGLSNQQ